MTDELMNTAEDIVVAKTGKEMPTESKPSLLEQANKAKEDNEKLLTMMSEERSKMERLMSDIAISGRGMAGQTIREPSQDDKDQSEADRYLKVLGRK